ncbi:MAG TPA: methylmalonyl-CoA mutase subunit beta [Pricia sp.]|nr:methylmalonyl-CoA mutase subunit beta [Pricia sp.]
MEPNLLHEFVPVSVSAWKQKIQEGLQGRDFDETLVWQSPEGIRVHPLYHAAHRENWGNGPSKGKLSWQVAEEIFVADSANANKKALDTLGKGAEILIFTVASEAVDLKRLLDGVDLASVSVHFDFRYLVPDLLEKVLDVAGKYPENIHPDIDIIGHLARTGNWFFDEEKDFGFLQDLLATAGSRGTRNVLGVDLSVYQNAGANIVQQLAYALAHAIEYLNRFDAETCGNFGFKICVGANYFFEIAKIRALRILWKTLAMEFGATDTCFIRAHPTKRNKTLYDYNVNMLRSTTECMSAILGGANTVCNLPYDAFYHKNNEFAERIARNQLLILKEESYFDAIENPATGSYYIETLTQQLAEKALKLFKDIEAHGGLLQHLKDGTIQRKIKESADNEQRRFDSGEEILIGTNAYQNPTDTMKNNLESYPFLKKKQEKTSIAPILESRLAEQGERERLEKEGWEEGSLGRIGNV